MVVQWTCAHVFIADWRYQFIRFVTLNMIASLLRLTLIYLMRLIAPAGLVFFQWSDAHALINAFGHPPFAMAFQTALLEKMSCAIQPVQRASQKVS